MKGLEYDITYGLHSNIPACCIVFYLTEWTRENERDSPYARAVHGDLINYVPCPECFALRRFVALRRCDRDCGKPCHREYGEREPDAMEHAQIQAVCYMLQDKTVEDPCHGW